MEIKKAFKMYPKMLLVAFLLLISVAGISFAGVKYFYQDSTTFQINVAVVDEAPNEDTSLAISYVKQIKNLSQNCNFNVTDKETAFKLLEEGKISALVYLPKNIINGILNGTNTPAQVYFPENSTVESTILKEYATSAISMLQLSQAQIYSINDVAKEFEQKENLSKFEKDINIYNLTFALNRLNMYVDNEESQTGSLSLIDYYIVSGIMLFLLLFGMALYPVMIKYNKAFTYKANQIGVTNVALYLNKTITTYLIYILTFALIYISTSLILPIPQFGFKEYISLLIVLLCITTFIQTIYVLSNENVSSILFVFFVTVLFSFVSGAIMPTIYLPKILQTTSLFLPTTYIKKAIADIYLLNVNTSTIFILLIFSIIFISISIFYKKAVQNREIY